MWIIHMKQGFIVRFPMAEEILAEEVPVAVEEVPVAEVAAPEVEAVTAFKIYSIIKMKGSSI